MEFKTLPERLHARAGQIVRTGRRIVYRLLAWNPWQHVFLRAMEALAGSAAAEDRPMTPRDRDEARPDDSPSGVQERTKVMATILERESQDRAATCPQGRHTLVRGHETASNSTFPITLVLGLGQEAIFRWEGVWLVSKYLLLACAILLVVAGGRHYSFGQFIGISQLRGAFSGGLATGGGIDSSGVLGLVRHPWYTAVVLFLWAATWT